MKPIYVNEENKADILCPGCGKSKTIDASKYMKVDGPVKIKYRFKCTYCERKFKNFRGHEVFKPSIITLERRKYRRKKVSLQGEFITKHGKKEHIVISNLSRTGLKFILKSAWVFQINDLVKIEFNLDNSTNTFISKEALVKKIDGPSISVAFTSFSSYSEVDKAIGFYLMG